jgi:hypothetical protein
LEQKEKRKKGQRNNKRRKPKGVTKGERERERERESVSSGRKQGNSEHMGRKNDRKKGVLKDPKRLLKKNTIFFELSGGWRSRDKKISCPTCTRLQKI